MTVMAMAQWNFDLILRGIISVGFTGTQEKKKRCGMDPIFPDTIVFTGSRGDGTGNQTSGRLGSDFATVAAAGRADLTDLRWINEGGFDAITERRFYALSEVLVPEPGPVPLMLVALATLTWLRARARVRRKAA